VKKIIFLTILLSFTSCGNKTNSSSTGQATTTESTTAVTASSTVAAVVNSTTTSTSTLTTTTSTGTTTTTVVTATDIENDIDSDLSLRTSTSGLTEVDATEFLRTRTGYYTISDVQYFVGSSNSNVSFRVNTHANIDAHAYSFSSNNNEIVSALTSMGATDMGVSLTYTLPDFIRTDQTTNNVATYVRSVMNLKLSSTYTNGGTFTSNNIFGLTQAIYYRPSLTTSNFNNVPNSESDVKVFKTDDNNYKILSRLVDRSRGVVYFDFVTTYVHKDNLTGYPQ
jgi:hypothetical protein